MILELIALFGIAAAAYALVGGVLGKLVPPPLYFAAFGAIGAAVIGTHGLDVTASRELIIIALCVMLFTDASTLDLRSVRHGRGLELRLLLLGMPLVIGAAMLLGWWLVPGLTAVELLLLAAVLSPTDAALVDPVLHDERVPSRLREATTIEAGLNDGLATPIIAVAAAGVGVTTELHPPDTVAGAVLNVLLGAVVGMVVGGGFAWLATHAERRGWASTRWEVLSLVGVAVVTYGLSEAVGAIALVAVFVAGAAFGTWAPETCRRSISFSEHLGQVLSGIVFMWFGVVVVDQWSGSVEPAYVAFGVLLALVGRPLTVWISTIGTGIGTRARLFLGWYGPRGLASVLFLVLLVEGQDLPAPIAVVVVTTIVTSLLLHGLSSGLASRISGPAEPAAAVISDR